MKAESVLILSADENVLDRRIANQVVALSGLGLHIDLWMIIPSTFVPDDVRSAAKVWQGTTYNRGGLREKLTDIVRGNALLISLYHFYRSFRSPERQWQALVPTESLPRADLVVANDLPCLIPALAIARRHGAKTLFDAHEIYDAQTDALYSSRLRALWLRIAKQLVPQADMVVTVNGLIADEMRTRYHLAATPTAVQNVCGYVAPDQLLPQALRELSGLHQSTLLVCAGEVRPSRQLDEFIYALAQLSDPDVGLVFLGHCSSGYRKQLSDLAERLGVSARVCLGKFVAPDLLVPTLAGADLGLISNRGEGPNNKLGGPNRLYEYIQARIPILTFEHQGIEEVLNQTNTGVAYRWQSAGELAEFIQAYLVAAKDIPAATFEAAAVEFCWESEEAKFVDAARSALQ